MICCSESGLWNAPQITSVCCCCFLSYLYRTHTFMRKKAISASVLKPFLSLSFFQGLYAWPRFTLVLPLCLSFSRFTLLASSDRIFLGFFTPGSVFSDDLSAVPTHSSMFMHFLQCWTVAEIVHDGTNNDWSGAVVFSHLIFLAPLDFRKSSPTFFFLKNV